MLKWFGSILILLGGGGVCWLRISANRRETETLRELLSAILQMKEEIRLTRMRLPELMLRLANGRIEPVACFFRSVAQSMRTGIFPADAWRQALNPLAKTVPSAVAEVGDAFRGDEEQICQSAALAERALQRALKERESLQLDWERRTTAMCFSAAALLVILLL